MSDVEEENEQISVQVLLPSAMEIDSSGVAKFKEPLNVGNIILADEGQVCKLKFEKQILDEINKKVEVKMWSRKFS